VFSRDLARGIRRQQMETESVKPGINSHFLIDLNPTDFLGKYFIIIRDTKASYLHE
jgi:hypothetical protein